MIIDYIVTNRDNRWWVMNFGHCFGPFDTILAATQSAISSAKIEYKIGQAARVTVEHHGSRIVWDSSDPDAPGQTVAIYKG